LVRTLPSREQLVVRLYFQHGPEPLSPCAFLELITSLGLPAQEVRALQRRFRRVCRSQHRVALCHLTHTTIAELFDVDRETIRRLLGKALHHLQEALASSPPEVSV
jgi:hypothetical protein